MGTSLGYVRSRPTFISVTNLFVKSNVLILSNMTACIADFGLSSMLGDLQAGTTYLAATAMYPGAVRWTAPELLESDDLQPTTLSDIYSLGSIMLQVSILNGSNLRKFLRRSSLLQVLSGKVPWHEIKREVLIIRKIHLGHTPPCPSQSFLVGELWPFIDRCWSFKPNERPAAGNVLEFIRRLRESLQPSPVDDHVTPSVPVGHSASSPGSSKRPLLKIIT